MTLLLFCRLCSFVDVFSLFSVNQDCLTMKSAGFNISGVYQLDPDGKGSFQVLCDMVTEGGGWAVMHRRFNMSVNFNRIWNEYKSGFGEMKTGEFWLGNDYIHRITAAKPTKLLIELEDSNGLSFIARYSSITVQDEGNLYRLDVSGYSGTAGDALVNPFSGPDHTSSGMAFTTTDRDNDMQPGNNCADTGGWWFN